jgi:hypothetical protein
MSIDPVAFLEARVQQAEDLWRRGEFAEALHEYIRILRERLVDSRHKVAGPAALTAADMVVAERVSDLAVLFGHADAADDLLAGVVANVEQAGNVFWADFVRAKRIDLTLGRGLLREAYEMLSEMRPRIGEVREIDFSPAGLARWESNCHWPQTDRADRAVIFTLLYMLMGRVLLALGQYSNAVRALERDISHAGTAGAHDLARQAIPALSLSSPPLYWRGVIYVGPKRGLPPSSRRLSRHDSSEVSSAGWNSAASYAC